MQLTWILMPGCCINGENKDPSGVLYEHYGDILYRSGEHQEALKMWKKAAEMGGGVSEELNDKIQSGKLSD